MSRRRLPRFARISPLVLMSLALAGSGASAQTATKPATQDELARVNESVDALTKKVWPSVVQILVNSYGAREAEGKGGDASVVVGRQRSVGSGFVIDAEGYILTNAHVVSGAQRVQIVLPADNADGTLATALSGRMKLVQARIVGIATELDLALLKVDGLNLPALPLATYSQVRQGETVFAFGSPLGLRNSLTHGLVSAVARQVDPDSPAIYVQTDAPINPGNSGGPLVNIRGEVVGVNTFILSQGGGDEGLGFAIPSATARTAFRQLKQFGHLRRQEVGMSMQTITPAMAAGLSLPRDYGVIVSDVWPRGPAEAAGLKVGDILVSVDGQPAENLPTVSYNFRLRDSKEPVKLVVLRAGSEVSLSVAPVEQGDDFDTVSVGGRSGEEPRVGAGHPRRGDRLHHRGRIARAPRSVRHHRRGEDNERGHAAAAERRDSQPEQPADLHAAGAQERARRALARLGGGVADSACGAIDVRLVHAGVRGAFMSGAMALALVAVDTRQRAIERAQTLHWWAVARSSSMAAR